MAQMLRQGVGAGGPNHQTRDELQRVQHPEQPDGLQHPRWDPASAPCAAAQPRRMQAASSLAVHDTALSPAPVQASAGPPPAAPPILRPALPAAPPPVSGAALPGTPRQVSPLETVVYLPAGQPARVELLRPAHRAPPPRSALPSWGAVGRFCCSKRCVHARGDGRRCRAGTRTGRSSQLDGLSSAASAMSIDSCGSMEDVAELRPCVDPSAVLAAALKTLQASNMAKRLDLDWQAQNEVRDGGCCRLGRKAPGLWFRTATSCSRSNIAPGNSCVASHRCWPARMLSCAGCSRRVPLQALTDCRRLVAHHSASLPGSVHPMLMAVLPAVDALRSQTSRDALALLQVPLCSAPHPACGINFPGLPLRLAAAGR